MRTPHFRTPWNYDRDEASLASGYIQPGNTPEYPWEACTQQQFKEETDINEIVRRFGLTGQLPGNPNPPQYGDFTGITDYQSALNAVIEAEEGFMQFPANIREQFQNDPQRMLEFLADEGNRAEAIEMGLIARPPEKTRDAVQAIDELKEAMTPKTV